MWESSWFGISNEYSYNFFNESLYEYSLEDLGGVWGDLPTTREHRIDFSIFPALCLFWVHHIADSPLQSTGYILYVSLGDHGMALIMVSSASYISRILMSL